MVEAFTRSLCHHSGGLVVKGFKDFILRGNVAALAVAFVIGGAFGALVQGFVKDLVTPLIAIPGGGQEFANATFTIGKGTFHYGDFVNLVLAFIVIAAAIYFVLVLPMERLEARRDDARPAGDDAGVPRVPQQHPPGGPRCAFCTA